MSDANVLAVGCRLSLRTTARYALSFINAERWDSDEVAALERLAAMNVDGIPFGDWPPPTQALP